MVALVVLVGVIVLVGVNVGVEVAVGVIVGVGVGMKSSKQTSATSPLTEKLFLYIACPLMNLKSSIFPWNEKSDSLTPDLSDPKVRLAFG